MSDNDILHGYLPWLRVVAGNLIGFEHPDLQDLVQEGYIAMWKAIRNFKAGSAPLDFWLKYNAHNRMKTVSVRWAARDVPDSLNEPVNCGAQDIELGDTIEDLTVSDLLEHIGIAYHYGQIAQAIDRLTPQQRKYVIARFWLGLSGNEMVELGVFTYDPSALWNSKRNGARWKLQEELKHLAGAR